MVLALTLSLLTAAPETSVVVARRLSLDAVKGNELAEELATALARAPPGPLGTLMPVEEAKACLSKAGFPDTAVCNGASACVASLAKVCGFNRLVSLQLAKIGADVAVDVSVVDGATGTSMAAVTSTLPLKNSSEAMRLLAAELLSRLAPSSTPLVAPVKEAPVVTREEVGVAPTLSTHRKIAFGLGGGSVLALGAGIALGVTALSQSKQLSVLAPDYATQVMDVRRTALFADLSYGLAGALAVSALVLWLVSPGTAP